MERLGKVGQNVFPTLPITRGTRGRNCGMDAIDKKILAELQSDGRLTLTDLSERVGLSMSPCHRRLRALEQAGIVAGYHAQLDAPAVGLTFDALVFVTMRGADRDTIAGFEDAVAQIPNVLQAQRLFGEPDYLLRVIATDLPAFQHLYDTELSALPGVQKLTSTLVMKTIVENKHLPLA
jgi:DNA-binding Lrp family transcriptional regulator